MKVMVCIGQNGGMLFNGRRQSRDRCVIEDMIASAGEGRLYINEFSKSLFAGRDGVVISNSFLDEAQAADYCFVENVPLRAYQNRITQITVYHWNRAYPADVLFDIDLKHPDWHLIQTTEFAGSSHEKITKEVYQK